MNAGMLEKSVAIVKSSSMQGTGFFISARLLLTAAHVVGNVGIDEHVSVRFRGRDLEATVLDKRTDHTNPWPFPDLALLQLSENVADALPLPLTERTPPIGTPVYTRGFPLKAELGGEDATTKVDGQSNPNETDPQRFRFKLSEGQLQPGMSGAPAVLATGYVAGVITLTRDERSDLGGYFTPTRELVRAFGTHVAEFVVANDLPSKIPYVTVPPLPENYVARTEILNELRLALTRERATRSIAMIAIQGMGGLGKTLLAQAISLEESLSATFPDGIIWIPIGKESTRSVATLMRTVAKPFDDHPEASIDDLQAMHWYRTALRDKAALIVLDDVWHASDLDSFRAEAPRSRVMFTTRDAKLAETYAAEVIAPRFLTPEQSREMLASWSNLSVDALPPEVDILIHECGGLVLALATIGAMVRGKPPRFWRYVHDLFQQADFEKLKQQFPDYPYPDLLRALQVSVDALDKTTRERYYALAALVEDMPAHPLVQQALWETGTFGAIETADEFVRLSLAQRAADGESIQLHDLMLDLVRGRYADPKALNVIHGAMRLSAHVIDSDPAQFASQLVGRLLPYVDMPAVRAFSDSLVRGAPRPWLRPLKPALQPPGTGLRHTLSGHTDGVTAVAVTPDGGRAVSASRDATLKVWELETGRELHTLTGHSYEVTAVAVTVDGRRALSASTDKTLKLWDLASGRELLNIGGLSGAVSAVALMADGRQAVSADEYALTVWDLESGRELRSLPVGASRIAAIALTPDARLAVVACADGTLTQCDIESGRELPRLAGSSDRVHTWALTPGGRCIISSSGADLTVWELENSRHPRSLAGGTGGVTAVAVTPDGRRAVCASKSLGHTSGIGIGFFLEDAWELTVWDIERGCARQTSASRAVSALALTPDGRYAVTGSDDGTLEVRALADTPAIWAVEGDDGKLQAVSADGRLAVSQSGSTVRVWELRSGRVLRNLEYTGLSVTHATLTPDGRCAISAYVGGMTKLWDVESGRELRSRGRPSGDLDSLGSLAVTPDSRFAVCTKSWSFLVWELQRGRDWSANEEPPHWGRDIAAMTPDGRRVVCTSGDTLELWELPGARLLRTLRGHAERVNTAALTPDSRCAISGSDDRTLKVWDLETGHQLRTLEGHIAPVNAIALTPDYLHAVSASDDRTLRVWELASGRVLRTFEGHTGSVNAVALSPNGRYVVSASDDGTLRVWDLQNGARTATFSCDASVRRCVFANHRNIVADDKQGRLHILDLETS